MRFLFYYRVYLPKEDLVGILQFFTGVRTASRPLKSVIEIGVFAFLSVKHGDFVMYKNIVPFFNSENISSVAPSVFQLIYSHDKSNSDLSESLTKVFFVLIRTLGAQNGQFF